MVFLASQKVEQTPAFHADIYPPPSFYNETPSKELIRDKLACLAVSLQAFIDHHCNQTLQGYVWQREKLSIRISNDGEGDRIQAYMRHGGSVEDEWLAVHLFLLANTKDSLSGLRINVHDEDGQFILIETADVLPNWVQPSNAEGRFWIVDGEFHLITPEQHMGDGENVEQDAGMEEGKPLRHATALQFISSSKTTKAPQSLMDKVIQSRLSSFPSLDWAKDVQHSTLVYLPQLVVSLITKYPQVIANAAESFEAREGPGDARILRDLKVFGIDQSQDTLLPNALVQIKLPKRLYATLLTERYYPPKVFGKLWRENVLEYWDILEKEQRQNLRSDEEEVISRKERGRRREIGCKIACGLELAYANAKERSLTKPKGMFDVHDEVIRSSSSYDQFIKSLTGLGYFGAEIRESSGWKQKEMDALQLWRKMMVDVGKDDTSSEELVDMLEMVKKITPETVLVDDKQNAKTLRLLEDPDDFLYDPKTSEAVNEDNEMRDEDVENIALQHLDSFSNKLQGFVEGEGDEVGALFEDENVEEDEEEEEKESQLEAKNRFASLSMEDRRRAMEMLVPRIQDTEWGAGSKIDHSEMQLEEEILSEGVRPVTLSGFSSRNQYDGASDSDESVDDEILRAGDTDEDRLNRARSLDIELALLQEEKRRQMALEDGDLLEDEDEGWEDEGEEEEESTDRFGQDEIVNFLEFARKELGLTESQYQNILQERREKGQSVPDFTQYPAKETIQKKNKGKEKKKVSILSAPVEESYDGKSDYEKLKEAEKKGQTFRQQTQENVAKSLRNERTTESEKAAARLRAENRLKEVEEQAAIRKIHQGKNLANDPFQKLMDSMDAELSRLKENKTKGEEIMSFDQDSEDEEMVSAQDAELIEKMLHDSLPSSLRTLLEKHDKDPHSMTEIECQVMENMLKSYQAQMGQAGPVGNLMGRFGIQN